MGSTRLTLPEFAETVSATLWTAYQAARRDEQRFVEDEATVAARERRIEVEREFKAALLATASGGGCVIEGRDPDALSFTHIDPRLLREAKVDFLRNAIRVQGQYLVDICVTQSSGGLGTRSLPGDQGEKEKLRARLREWFERLEKQGAEPQGKSAWKKIAKNEKLEFTDNLFQGVWRELGHPHALKLNGRKRKE